MGRIPTNPQKVDGPRIEVVGGVAELDGKIPTTENLALLVWARLEGKLEPSRLVRVRLFESPDLYVEVDGDGVS